MERNSKAITMSSIVLELQQDALDRNIQISDLLRKALVIAKKLGLKEFEEWISFELNGYSNSKDVPEYRQVTGEIKAFNPYHGWQPVFFDDPSWADNLSKCPLGQSVAEIEDLLESKDNKIFHRPFPKELEKTLMDNMNMRTQVTLNISRPSLIKILDTTRTIVLNWSLKLEEDGVLGEGLTFTKEEKLNTSKQSYNINNFYGAVHSPQIQQQPEHSIQISYNFKNDLDSIKSFINLLQENKSKLSVSREDAEELGSEIKTIEAQIKSPKPKQSIIKEGLATIGKILEGAGGNIAAHLLIELGKLMF